MKISITIALTLIFALSAFGQKSVADMKAQLKTFKETNDRQYKISYDKFTDKTRVLFQGPVVSQSFLPGRMLQLLGAFVFEGENLKVPVTDFALMFQSTGKDWDFLRNRELFVIADGERMALGEGLRDGDIKRTFLSGYQTSEVLGFRLTREQLEKMANAKELEMKVGERQFKLGNGGKRGFANLLALSQIP